MNYIIKVIVTGTRGLNNQSVYYFKEFHRYTGEPTFTSDISRSWRFDSKEEAEAAKKSIHEWKLGKFRTKVEWSIENFEY